MTGNFKKLVRISIIGICLLSGITVSAQGKPFLSVDSIASNFYRQRLVYPQEKIHLHMDKSHYVSGEKMWFRAFLVDAFSHLPETASHYVYVELINPAASVVARVKIRPIDSMYYGYIGLPENLAGGNYIVRAYTNYMCSLGEDYFFRKNIFISNPLELQLKAKAEFSSPDDKGKREARISLWDLRKKCKLAPTQLSIWLNQEKLDYTWVSRDSVAEINFRLPFTQNSNQLYIEAGNFHQFITIPGVEQDFDVSFFPEGGYLLEGTACQVGFKALNNDGVSKEVSVDIFDQDDNLVVSAHTFHKGMGSFLFCPESGKKYYAVCKDNHNLSKRFELPEAQKNMYSLKVSRWNKGKFLVSVLKSAGIKDTKPLFLLVHSKGDVKYAEAWDFSNDFISFDEKSFPSGIIQFVLLDEQMNPLSERLIFCLNDDQAVTTYKTDSPAYGSRQHVEAQIRVTDAEKRPLTGNFSIAVTDDRDVTVDTNFTIYSNLLLTSELKGNIEDPAFYLQKNNRKARAALDVLMLTQGWRRYRIPEVIRGKFEEPSSPLEIGQEITGEVRTIGLFKSKPMKDGKVSAMSLQTNYLNLVETDENGKFRMNGFEFPDSTEFILRALTKKGKQGIELIVYPDSFPAITLPVRISSEMKTEIKPGAVEKADLKYTYENGMRMIYLDEVTVRGIYQEKQQIQINEILATATFDAKDIEEMGATKVEDVLMRVAGVRIGVDGKIYIRTPTSIYDSYIPPIVVIDGMEIEDQSSSDPYFNPFESVNMQDIARIEVIKVGGGKGAYHFGKAGMIVITRKKIEEMEKNNPQYNIKRITPLGYQKPLEFYSPKYELAKEKESKKPDLRTTLFWKPDIKLSEKGRAKIDFYTADGYSTYSVVIEGITTDGRLIRTDGKIYMK